MIEAQSGLGHPSAQKYALLKGQSGFPAQFLDCAALHRGYDWAIR
jgi:hypothetical protein